MANPRTISQILAEITVLYPLMFSVTPEMTATWSAYLRDLPDDLLVMALHHYVGTAKDNYPPSVPALRRAAADLKRLAAGVPTQYEAWENLLAVGNGGYRVRITTDYDEDGRQIIQHYKIEFAHPLIEQVAKQMGWPKFPSHDDVEIDRAHFLKAYDAAVTKLTTADMELPEVRAFIEQSRQPALMIGELARQLEAK